MIDRLREYRPTRRQVLRAGIGTGLFVAGGAVNRLLVDSNAQIPQKLPTETTPPKETTMDELLQEILNIPPFVSPHIGSQDRIRAELEYLGLVSKDPTVKGIDRGFWVFSHQPARAELLNLRYSLRQKGTEEKLKPLSEEKVQWAKEQRIHPEVLGICLDNYERAKKIIAVLDKEGKLRDDEYKLKEPDEAMMNAGGLAMLITTETGPFNFLGQSYGFTNIGQDIAINQMFGEDAEKDKLALERLSKKLSKIMKLNLTLENIAGSVKGGNDSSGGAVAVQFRPMNAEKITETVEKATGEILNVFDVNDGPVMAWIFLARHEWVGKDSRGNDLYRVGYRRGIPVDITNAIVKWYGAPIPAASKTEAAAYDYHPKFIEGKPGAH